MYLFGRKIKAQSIKNPYNIALPSRWSESRESEILMSLREGRGHEVIDEIVHNFLPAAINIAGQYAHGSDKALDYLQEAVLAIYSACENIDKLGEHPFNRFVKIHIHRRISKYIDHDQVVRTPGCTSRRTGKIPASTVAIGEHGKNHNTLCELNEILNLAIKTPREREVIDLRKESFNDSDIALILCMQSHDVWLLRNRVRKRFETLMES